MSQKPRWLVALALWLLTLPACAYLRGPTAEDRTAMRTVIERQLEAFRWDDAARAFALSSPEIQAKFGTPENFMAIVKTHYQPVYRPRRIGGFTEPRVIEGMITQPVLLIGPDGQFVLALYTLHKQPDGEWKITGSSLVGYESAERCCRIPPLGN
jgi:Domain of unknown function (DUF4864)